MRVERTSGISNFVDVRIELVTVEARVVVASIGTYLGYSDVLSDLKQAGAPQPGYPVSAVGKNLPIWGAV